MRGVRSDHGRELVGRAGKKVLATCSIWCYSVGMTSTGYAVAPAPKFAAMQAFDCTRCGRAEVKPIFLTDGAGARAYGTGCAALLLGYPSTSGRKVRDLADAADRAEAARVDMLAERTARYATALAEFEADANANPPALSSCRRTYHQAGGSTVLGSFPAWLARVAATGSLD